LAINIWEEGSLNNAHLSTAYKSTDFEVTAYGATAFEVTYFTVTYFEFILEPQLVGDALCIDLKL
jgi:hypothetical protein